MVPTIKWIEQNFNIFNKKYFDSKLPTPKFSLNCPDNMWGFYDYKFVYNMRRQVTKILSVGELCLTSKYSRNEIDVKSTLLHEMIHMYIYLIARIYPKNEHGKEFQFFASYINRDGYNVSATGVEKKDSDILNGGINENNKFKNMKKIIISEEQEISLIKILREEKEKHEKKYSIDPNKVLILKKKLDKSFIPLDYELIKGGNADCIKIAGRLTPKTRQVIEKLYEEDLADWAADCCKDMFLDNDECEKFAKLVVNRWLNNNIGVHGMLDVNYFY